MEYYYNDSGCTAAIERCLPPLGNSDPDDIFIRRNYLLVQFADTRIKDVFSAILRWIHDIDDSSSRFNAILNYEIKNHVSLFTVGDYFEGEEDSEFGSVLNYSVFAGIQVSF